MALLKLLNIGDELVFNLEDGSEKEKQISIFLTEKLSRIAVLKIECPEKIRIRQFRQIMIPGERIEIK